MTGLLVSEGALRWDSQRHRLHARRCSCRRPRRGAAAHRRRRPQPSRRPGPQHLRPRPRSATSTTAALVQKLAYAPMACLPGECYALPEHRLQPDRRRRVRRDRQVLSARQSSARIFKPLGMNDASTGLEGIESSPRWAKPHVRGRGGWVSLMPKPNYYRVAPAAGVNASISDMAQWLIAQTGHRPDVLPASLLATLHAPVIDTPSELRGSSWRARAPERRRLRASAGASTTMPATRRVPWRRGAGLSRRGRDAAGTRPGHRDPLEQRELAAQRPAADDPRQRDRPGASTGWTTHTLGDRPVCRSDTRRWTPGDAMPRRRCRSRGTAGAATEATAAPSYGALRRVRRVACGSDSRRPIKNSLPAWACGEGA